MDAFYMSVFVVLGHIFFISMILITVATVVIGLLALILSIFN